MTIQLPKIEYTTDNWMDLFAKINYVIDELGSRVVTAESNSTVGAVTVVGSVRANNTYTDVITGGTALAPADITVQSNTVFSRDATINRVRVGTVSTIVGTIVNSGGLLNIAGANNTIVTHNARHQYVTDTVTTTAAKMVYTLPKNAFRSAKIHIHGVHIPSAQTTAAELLACHNNNEAFITEYAIVNSGTQTGTLTANTDATTVRFWYEPTAANTSIQLRVVSLT